MREIFMKIKDMKCSGCEGTIRKRLLRLEGVFDARANFKTGKLLLNVTPDFQPSEVPKVMQELGYTLDEHTNGTLYNENISTE